ncbi:unnamed protein product [Closterium sp. NIES-65]|nr:unnamed protein product [Closterium sp. NIES-65]CAI5984649.1 unnamed protein product [Closterium sp. NIES-65]
MLRPNALPRPPAPPLSSPPSFTFSPRMTNNTGQHRSQLFPHLPPLPPFPSLPLLSPLSLPSVLHNSTLLVGQLREPYLTHTLGGSYLSTSSREIMRLEENLERVAACLAAIRRMWPDLPQTTLDLAKIAFNRHLRQPTFPSTSALSLPPFSLVISPLLSLPPPPCHQDIGKAVLESYSRVLEGAASNIRARLRDVLHADHLFNNPQLFPLQDAPSDPRPQHLRHPTFSLLMPDTVFDAVSVSGGSESSASIRSFESSRSGSSGKGGRHFRASQSGGGGGNSGGSSSRPPHPPNRSASGDWT